MNPRTLLSCSLLICAALAGFSCTAPRKSQASPSDAPITNTDPCATRLHDLCGPLLLYYATHRQLPPQLEELRSVSGLESAVELVCPVSGRPYLYNPQGILLPEQQARVVIYDPLPSHSGMRWGISIIEPSGPGPLITKVIALPESVFRFQPK